MSEMLCAVAGAAASLPLPLIGSLLEQIHTRRWNDQAPEGDGARSPFTARELAVFRQLAALREPQWYAFLGDRTEAGVTRRMEQ
ncbi:hypothetical protein [Streptomyces sp. NPDC002265]|uniref:hypothetical protein n=1 Tax=Streptomyces sp. NPDC002265 TaxID=3154415 RepID=UPI00332802C7